MFSFLSFISILSELQADVCIHNLQGIGPFEFKLSRLFKENVVLWSNDVIIPESGDPLRNNYVVVFSMPTVRTACPYF